MDTVPTLQSEAAARKAAAAADPQPRAMTGRSSPSGNGAGDSSNAATNSSGAEGRVNKLMDTLVLLLSDLALVGEAERRAVQGRWTVLVEASKQTGAGLEAGNQYNEGAKDLNGRNKTAQEKAKQEGKDEEEVGLEVMHFKLKAIGGSKEGQGARQGHARRQRPGSAHGGEGLDVGVARGGSAPKGLIAQKIEAVKKNTFWI